ncbi:phenylacetic acid degradation protein [Candidatus Poribacteria bacterium]|nr:phenylacetic acid degradation protein [Candidatus Poribacteria bacterium]MBT5536536.1 phenylacetic acid degradation protein [Candidatus Poribacteria bacterium]MBT7100350.1 phenylacetic acid degradation protein [Candidatus Poribacteria bacterium]MBT7805568.1 phenylacetic acid degradation protein [Candidatus Poribacteria bacterium]
MTRHACGLWIGLLCLVSATARADLIEYVAAPDATFRWEYLGARRVDECTVHDLHLVSQTWQGIVWEHAMQVYVPDEVQYPETLLLEITGGRTGDRHDDDHVAFGVGLAAMCGAVSASLAQVPNQPLLGDRSEDDLIAHTFVEYLRTGDRTLPLLLPMTKSAVRAMDALQEFCATHLDREIGRFVTIGGSKRGWTSWLTAAVDTRVVATVPLVIDTLNMPEQMDHQVEVWGEYSEQIEDYTQRGLTEDMDAPDRRDLWQMVDPVTYRDRLTVPKLSIIGTNDRYFVLDAMNLYWDDLLPPKHVLYVPNSGHGIEDRVRGLAGVAGYFRFVASETALPSPEWEFETDGARVRLVVAAGGEATDAQLWLAGSETADFRSAAWMSVPMLSTDSGFVGEAFLSPMRHIAVLGELRYPIDGMALPLSTQVRVFPPLAD